MSKKLYSIELADHYLVVVDDGQDPLETLLWHCPDSIDVEHLPGYWDEDWPEDMPESEIFDLLLKNIVVEEFTGSMNSTRITPTTTTCCPRISTLTKTGAAGSEYRQRSCCSGLTTVKCGRKGGRTDG